MREQLRQSFATVWRRFRANQEPTPAYPIVVIGLAALFFGVTHWHLNQLQAWPVVADQFDARSSVAMRWSSLHAAIVYPWFGLAACAAIGLFWRAQRPGMTLLMLTFAVSGVASDGYAARASQLPRLIQLEIDARVSLDVDPQALRLAGSFPASLRDRVKQLVNESPFQPKLLLLGDNRGGSTDAMFEIFHQVQELDLSTVIVDGRCDSSCAYLAILMPKRYITPSGVLAFHAPWTGFELSATEQQEREKLAQAFKRRGIAHEVIEQLLVPGDVVSIAVEDLCRFNLVDGFVERPNGPVVSC